MKQIIFTTDDYQQAIHREIQKRITTYPKIITKMRKRGAEDVKIQETYLSQEKQFRWIKYAAMLVRYHNDGTVLDRAFKHEILDELLRELKERKRCYPRWVKVYRMMTQETADYELAVWENLTRWFAKEYLNLHELPTKRKKKQ